MDERSQFVVKTREDIAALFREKWGTDQIAWSIEPRPDETVSQATWLMFFQPELENGGLLVGRQDMKYFDVITRMRREGYPQPIIFEEPAIPFPEGNRPRVVGYIRVYVNFHGFVRTRSENTLIGQTLMIHPSSVSKSEPIDEQANLLATVYVYTNPQRIEGAVEVEILQMDFPDDDPAAMKVRELVVLSADGRSLSVAAKIMATTNA